MLCDAYLEMYVCVFVHDANWPQKLTNGTVPRFYTDVSCRPFRLDVHMMLADRVCLYMCE